MTVIVPASTEEWAKECLIDAGFDESEVTRTDHELSVRREVGGNVDAVTHALGVLRDVEDAFSEGHIDIDSLTLEVGLRQP